MQQPKPETIALEEVVITQELSRRSPRKANLPAENQAMRILAQQMVNATELMLQTLLKMALELCQADSAGASLLATIDGEEVFGSHQLAGRLTKFAVDAIPKDFSPCGVCLDRRTPQLFSYPERYFTYLQEPQIPIVEALLLPLIAEDRPLGTIWIMAHDEKRHFDAEDVRLMTGLADLTAAALLVRGRQTQELLSANAQLETAKEHNRVALEAAEMATWDWNLCANTVTWNEQHYRLLGLEPALKEEPAELFTRSVHPDDLAWVWQKLESAIAHNSIYQAEFRIIRADNGEVRWISGYGRVVDRQNGKATRMAGVMYDVTQRHQTEATLRESEKRLQATIANLPGGAVFIVDRDLRYLLAEGEALSPAGFTSADFVGRTIFEVLPPELVPSAEALYRQGLAGVTFEVEHNISDRTYVSRGTPLRSANGEVYAVLAVSYDITERKQGEAALRASEERFRLFVTASSDMVYRMSADWHQMRNLEGKNILANTDNPSDTWLETYIPQQEQPHVWAAIQEAIRTKSIFELEHQVIQQDGAIGWTFSRAIPMLNEQGDIVEWFGAASDVSDRKQAEAALRASEAKYSSLFELLDQGFCIFELIDNETQTAIDYRFLEVNQAFERQTKLANAVGKLGSEIAPNTERYWLEAYEKVARTGEPLRIENYNEDTERWYSAYASRIGGAGSRQVCTVFDDITNRKRAEAQLRRAAEMDAFRVRLSDALRPLFDAVEIQATVTRTTMNFGSPE